MILARRHPKPPVGTANLEHQFGYEPDHEKGDGGAHDRTLLRREAPVYGAEVAAASSAGGMVLIRGDAGHAAASEPYRSEVVVSETGASLTVLPDLEIVPKLAIARRSHDGKHAIFGVARIDRNRAALKGAAGREKHHSHNRQGSNCHGFPSDRVSLWQP